jgi:sialate O-acetylesterase
MLLVALPYLAATVTVFTLASLVARRAWARPTPADVFTDNMVLQRDIEAPVWGTAAPGEAVAVEVAGVAAETVADEHGAWRVNLSALSAGGPYDMVVRGDDAVTFQNVMVGEVWIASGQSNMQWPMSASMRAEEFLAAANDPDLRLFTCPNVMRDEPVDNVDGSWTPCTSQSVFGFSAVAYHFGRHLREELGVPVGLINASWGGSWIEAWISRPTLESDEAFAPGLRRYDNALSAHEVALADMSRRQHDYRVGMRDAIQGGGEFPGDPGAPGDPRDGANRPSGMYNGMIAPVVPYGLRGALWYQGESNAISSQSQAYRGLLHALINDWRALWGLGPFPFLVVQLPDWLMAPELPADDMWAEIRESQAAALELENTGLTVTLDIGDADDIHPTNKHDVGARLALNALRVAYERDVLDTGPTYAGMEVDDAAITVGFENIGSGLTTVDDKALTGFSIAGSDRVFYWAEAGIDGDTIVVRSDSVHHPKAVRYAWASNPTCNLTNDSGLPAPPFRTDDWPGITDGNL